MNVMGWAMGVAVLSGILTAWMDPSSAGLMHAVTLAIGAATAILAVTRRVALPVHWIALLPLACAAWGCIQVISGWTVVNYETWNGVSAWFVRAVVFAVAYAGFQECAPRERLRLFAMLFGAVFSAFALVQWYSGGGNVFWSIPTAYRSDIAGTFTNRDHYAALIELLLPIALAACVRPDRSIVLPVACVGLMFASVIAAGSRAGTIVVFAEVMVFLAAATFGRQRNRRAVSLIFASLMICTAIGGWGLVAERFLDPDPFAYRREMLTATLDMFRMRPVTGFGLGSWPWVYQAFAVFDPPGVYMNHAHNDWAEWASEGGIPLVAILAVFAFALIRRVRKNLWALGIPAVLAHAIVDFPLQKPALTCALFFLAGIAVAEAENWSRLPMGAEERDNSGMQPL